LEDGVSRKESNFYRLLSFMEIIGIKYRNL
jgi:hypothetical protein